MFLIGETQAQVREWPRQPSSPQGAWTSGCRAQGPATGRRAALRERVLGTRGHLAFGACLSLLEPRNKGYSKCPEQAAGCRALMRSLALKPPQLLFQGHAAGSGTGAVSLKMCRADSRALALAGRCVCACVYVCTVEVERQRVLGTELISGKRRKRAKSDCPS